MQRRCGGFVSHFRSGAVALILLGLIALSEQQNTIANWAWVGGDNFPNAAAISGTKGVPSTSNKPRARSGHATWYLPSTRELWIFGGRVRTDTVLLNDLWRFRLDDSTWTWMSGSANTSNNVPTYGTKGVPNAANTPGGRLNPAIFLVNETELWLYGGWGSVSGGSGLLGDLWRFNISSGMWTYMSGSQSRAVTGVYGTKGVYGTANYPPCRRSSTGWYDARNNELWMFGGVAVATDGNGQNGDMWRYSIGNNTWMWAFGPNTRGGAPVYGTLGVPNVANTPGSRSSHAGWFVPETREYWLVGGTRYAGTMNDLWKLRLNDTVWTWVGGSQAIGALSIYGSPGVADVSYTPGARNDAATFYDATNQVAWYFGGEGFTQNATVGRGYVDEVWNYRIGAGWSLLGGRPLPNRNGTYGTFGVPDSANTPGSRSDSGVLFDSLNGKFMVFGGEGWAGTAGALNCLWSASLVPLAPVAPKPPAAVIPPSNSPIASISPVAAPQNPPEVSVRVIISSASTTRPNATAICEGFTQFLSLTTSDWRCVPEIPPSSGPTTDHYVLISMVSPAALAAYNELYLDPILQSDFLNTIQSSTGGLYSGRSLLFDPPIVRACLYPQPPTAICDSSRGIWIIERTVSIVQGTSLVFITPSEVRGDFVAGPNTTITLTYQTTSLAITGCAKFEGNLILSGPPLTVSTNSSYLLATYGSTCPGQPTTFSTVVWQNPPRADRSCQTVNTQPQYGPTSLSLVLTLDSSACNSDSAVAGIGTGGVVGIAVAVIAVVALVIIAFVVYRKFFKSRGAVDHEELALAAQSNEFDPTTSTTSSKKSRSKGAAQTEYGALDIDKFNAENEGSAQIVSIPASDVKMLQRLGSGAYGEVWLGTMPDGAFVAVKRMKNSILASHASAFFSEAAIMMQITENPYVVQMYGVIADAGEYGLVLEFMVGGSLEAYLSQLKSNLNPESTKTAPLLKSESKLFDIAYSVASGLSCLAANGIVHRDLSARNILLDESKCFGKISDFGMSRKLLDSSSKGKTVSTIGPIRWMSPENIKDKVYSEKSDVWSFGCTLIEALTGDLPFSSFPGGLSELAIAIRDNNTSPLEYLEFDLKAHGLECPKWCLNLLKRCFAINPEDRPSFQEILKLLEHEKQDLYVSFMNRLENREAILNQLSGGSDDPVAPSSESFSTIAPQSSSQKGKNSKSSKRASAKMRGSVRLNRDVLGAKAIDSPVQLLGRLGEGSFGAVFLASLGGSYIAVKQLSLPQSSGASERAKAEGLIYSEAAIMAKLKKNRNVIAIYGLAVEGDKMSILMEFAARGSLESFVQKNQGKVPETLVFRWAIGIARGMSGLAAQKIIHRDLAARNVLLDSTFEPKISDFGLSRDIDDEETGGKTTSNTGPIRWMAPESLKQHYSEKSDVWAYGCVLVEILSGQNPYGDIDLHDIVLGVRDKGWTPLQITNPVQAAKYDSSWMQSAPSYLIKLAEMCFENDPTDRPTFDSIVQYLEDNIPERVAKIETRRQKAREKRAKLLEALDEIVV